MSDDRLTRDRPGGTTFAQRWSWRSVVDLSFVAAVSVAVLSSTMASADDDVLDLRVEPEAVVPSAEPLPETGVAGESALHALAAETVAAMQEAQKGFSGGTVDDQSVELQAGILERLERLAKLARQQSQLSTAGRSSPSPGSGARSNSAGDGQGAAGRNLDAAESNQAATGASNAAGPPETAARSLATSVWGHLPARQRDRMQSRFSERFLPQYDQLVRQYYEALATDGLPAK